MLTQWSLAIIAEEEWGEGGNGEKNTASVHLYNDLSLKCLRLFGKFT